MKRFKFSLRSLLIAPAVVLALLWLLTPHYWTARAKGYPVSYGVWYHPLVVKTLFIGRESGCWAIEVYWTRETRIPTALVYDGGFRIQHCR